MCIQTLRRAAALKQNYCCWYCDFQMWERNCEEFARKHSISVGEAKRFQCTAEHLIARRDGGTDIASNIVAACLFCNRTRHRMPSALTHKRYRHRVSRAIRKKKWHPSSIHAALGGVCR
ncbi:MAG: HNH endonuclease [Mesorhizobium sp.]|uniref:HNH endonuclease n=2 Tax=Mesorhizobium sp. TaxID=1871066 RepID=UPI000FE5F434|nr:MAG: HNH endonuclease [Mesorhizobium sp.]RWC55594.1 MAG: HNH endonuclease [Mesorhizobium sp.]